MITECGGRLLATTEFAPTTLLRPTDQLSIITENRGAVPDPAALLNADSSSLRLALITNWKIGIFV